MDQEYTLFELLELLKTTTPKSKINNTDDSNDFMICLLVMIVRGKHKYISSIYN